MPVVAFIHTFVVLESLCLYVCACPQVYRADAEKAVEDYTIETFTQAQIIELFDKMDPERRGWIEESEAVQFVADNPCV